MVKKRSGRPRVAVVYPIPFGPGGVFGGGERYALELARALAAETPTRLVTFGEEPGTRQLDELEIRTVRPLAEIRGERLNPLSLRFLAALRDADVIHCLAWNTVVSDLAVLFGRATGKRVFVTDVGGGASVTLQRSLPLARLVHGFLLIAEAGTGQFERYRDRIRIILAGIDTERFRPDDSPEARSGVLFVGRLLPHKGVDDLIRAVPPDVPLSIVGRPYSPEYYELLQDYARDKDVRFVTDASDDEVLRLYQRAAVAVLPSVYRTVYGHYAPLPELLGFTAMEAMACGTPVICTRVGGLPELVVDGVSGYLVPPNSPEALRDRIESLLSQPDHARQMGAAARDRIESHFTWESVAARCLTAYGA